MKKLLASTMTLAMILALMSVASFTVNAEIYGDYEYELIDDGAAVEISGYNGPGGDVTVPSTIAGKPVTSIGRSAFEFCDSLTSITIPDSVTTIGEGAFDSCPSLTNITIPDSVIQIGRYAFRNTAWYEQQPEDEVIYAGKVAYDFKDNDNDDLYGLSKIDCPKVLVLRDDTISIANEAFRDCGPLTTIVIPDSVTYIGDHAFWDCSSLISITIPSSVTYIGCYAIGDVRSGYKFETVYYGGTPNDRANMDIDEENKWLLNATWIYGDATGNGDASGDGSTDMKDVLQVRKFIAGLPGVSVDESAADVDGDGELTMKDVLIIRKFIAGLIETLG